MLIWVYPAILAIGFGAGWAVNGWRSDANQKAAIEQALKDREDQFVQQDTKALRHEKEKIIIRKRFVPITQEVERVVSKIEYRDVCLDDDGLRAVRAAIASSSSAASQPERAMP